jgi:hypothetical protein
MRFVYAMPLIAKGYQGIMSSSLFGAITMCLAHDPAKINLGNRSFQHKKKEPKMMSGPCLVED